LHILNKKNKVEKTFSKQPGKIESKGFLFNVFFANLSATIQSVFKERIEYNKAD